MNIRPLHNSILFRFEEEIERGSHTTGFKDKTEGGIYLGVSHERSTSSPRWGTVVSVGNSVKDADIQPGVRICIEALQWTNEVRTGGESFWRTDEDKVLLVDAA